MPAMLAGPIAAMGHSCDGGSARTQFAARQRGVGAGENRSSDEDPPTRGYCQFVAPLLLL
ncbi:hypothetical protein D3C84_141440 [compost metagenome]